LCKIINEQGKEVIEGESGELRIKGPTVFKEYYKKPDATKEAFDEEGWFKTGDIAVIHNKIFKILGRASIDIIKSGGYKISALEIETTILQHPNIIECAVVGLPDLEWGQKIAAIIVQKKETFPLIDIESLKLFLKDKIASYKIPKLVLNLDSIPKNSMHKINKKELVKLFF
jgi:malonyl-CoA/methylmalonyl-CoA synthetase